MESHRTSKTRHAVPSALRASGFTLAACLLLTASPAMAETVVSGQSDTILRIGRTAEKKVEVPAYEYLRLGIASIDGSGGTLSAAFGGWGRVSLNDTNSRNTYESDLQYGYISYQAARNNIITTAGRQFVAEGVAAERIDGLYLRSDIGSGFAASAFAGNPVITEPDYVGGDVMYGGRLSHSMNKFYTLGLSGLRSSGEASNKRQEIGGDLWLHPVKQFDLTGRSTYNYLTSDWMEHSYLLSLNPADKFRISADASKINYRHYFTGQTSSVFRIANTVINPEEELTTVGTAISIAPDKNLTISAKYKYFDYKIDDQAHYFGARLDYIIPESYAAGASVFRMDGNVNKLRYTEYRLYASKAFHNTDLTLDFTNLQYDESVNGVRNAYSVAAAGGYRFDRQLKLALDIDCSRTPDYDFEMRTLVKLTYAFDMKYAGEGRAK